MATIVTNVQNTTRKFHVNSAKGVTVKNAETGITSAKVIETTGTKWDNVGTVEFRTKPGTKSAKQYRGVTAEGQATEWTTSREGAVEKLAEMI